MPTQGTYSIVGLHGGKPQQKFAESLEDAYKHIEKFKAQTGTDVYFAVGSFEGFSRKAVDSIYFKSFFLDLDCGENKDYPSQQEALTALAQFLLDTKLPEPTVISSGYGVHVYWILSEDIPTKEWLVYSKTLKDLCHEKGLRADPSVTGDAARILRVPGTKNYKRESAVDVELLSDIVQCSLEEFVSALGGPKAVEQFDLNQVKKGLDDETRHMLGLDNYEFSFEKIAVESLEDRGCSHIKYSIINSVSLQEPQWVAGLSVAARCVDGPTAIHDFSSDHPNYNREATEEKAARTIREAKWAYTCKAFEERFRDINPDGCANCPFRGKIPSPTHIGKQLRIAQPGLDEPSVSDSGPAEGGDSGSPQEQKNEVVSSKFPKEYLTLPQFLYPYIRPISGGVWYEPAPEHKKDGTVIKKDPVMLLNHDFIPIKRLYSHYDGECLHMRLFLPHDGIREFILPMSTVFASEKFKDFIAKSGVLVTFSLIDKLRDYLVKWSQYLKQYQKADDMRMAMGWTDEPKYGSFVAGKVEINPSGRFDCPVTPAARNVADKIYESGSYDVWRKSADMLNRPGLEFHALGMLMGMGSPLMPFSNATGLMFSYCGEKGAGKTAAMHAGLSVFGDPIKQKIVTVDGATINGLWNRASTLNNLMMGIDETSNADPKKLSDIIYKGAMNNQGKIREQSSYNVERKQREGSINLTLLTTNQSNKDKMFMAKGDPGGELRRMLEIDLFRHSGKMQDSLGHEIFQPFNENFGYAGPMFIEYCYKLGIPEIDRTVKTWQTRLQQEFHNDSAYTFWNGGVAACMAAGQIGERAGIISLDYERIYQHLLKELHRLHDEYNSAGINYEDMLSEFLSINLNGILAFNESDKVSVEPRGKDLVARAEVTEGKVWISKSAIKDYLHEKQINVSHFEAELLKKGVMVNNKAKKKMAAGWKSAMGAMNLWCYEIKLDVSDVIHAEEPGPDN